MLRIIEKIEEVKRYPSTTPKHWKCSVCDITKPDEVFSVTLHESEVTLIQKLNAFQKSMNLYPETMNELWGNIEEFGQMKYEQGCVENE